MFACVNSTNEINIYNFYTTDCPATMVFAKAHVAKIRCFDWFENDLTLTACCEGGNIYFYDLHQHHKESGKRNTDYDYTNQKVKFTSVVNVPGRPYEVLAAGNDRTITSNAKIRKDQKDLVPSELPYVISQLCIIPSGKTLIAGLGGQSDKPGAI